MFPTKFNIQSIIDEHEAFHEGLIKMEEYLLSCLPIGEKWGIENAVVALSDTRKTKDLVPFDGEQLRTILESFVQPLINHVCHSSPKLACH
jgi:hypothetical protein